MSIFKQNAQEEKMRTTNDQQVQEHEPKQERNTNIKHQMHKNLESFHNEHEE